MRMTIGLLAVGVMMVATLGALALKRKAARQAHASSNSVHVVLVGASIGQGWQLAEWPTRMKLSGFTAESIPAWRFDKTEVVDEVLMRPARKFHPTRTWVKSLFQPPPTKPNIVILKECSSYFPGDLTAYKRSIETWVGRVQARNIRVILATVVPVTRSRAEQDPGKQESLLEYNQWVRQYAQQHSITVLDLESPLAIDQSGRYLRDEFATSDGSHLNAAAYLVLDEALRQTLGAMGVADATRSSALVAH